MKIWPFTKLAKTAAFNTLSLLASFFLILASAFLIWRNTANFPLAVPLWLSRSWGEDWLAAPTFLWLIPVLSLLLTVLNSLAAGFFWSRQRILSLLLIWTSPIICGLFFYTLLEIILVTI